MKSNILSEESQKTARETPRFIAKTLYPNFFSAIEIQRLKQESEILENINIDGVRKVRGFQNKDGYHQVFLENIEGFSIREYFEQHSLNLTEKVAFFVKISKILGNVHKTGIIHKNLNPEHILITKDDKVYLTNFGIASRFTLKQASPGNPENLEGNLTYLSPEQTGRMNRSVDYRADLYAIGATFFELLSGHPPFEADEALKLVYAHLAQTPPNPKTLNVETPEILAQIILKLLEKKPEDRYQSAFGLAKDLDLCLQILKDSKDINEFNPGEEDYSGKLQIPEKLYGREKEIQAISSSYQRVLNGAVELTLISGHPGTGKSALAHELNCSLAATKGYFIEGKFDQYQRDIPFYAWIQAFKSFIDALLTENKKTLTYWKDLILNALGDRGAVLSQVIPNLESVIGVQPQVPKLEGQEAQRHFHDAIQKFIGVISKRQHPLIIFIDDLQWADESSLWLLKTLLTDQENTHLLCVGAYRDKDINDNHPLTRTINEIRQENAQVNEIDVANLSQDTIELLLVETLPTLPSEHLKDLTSHIIAKTQGNAFFTRQWLEYLFQEGVLTFSYENNSWQLDMNNEEVIDFNDQVVEFITKKLQQLPANTQELLSLAACIGYKFNLDILEIIPEKKQIKQDLELAVLEGFIYPLRGNNYTFVHSHIQEAAYSLIPEDQKLIVHLKAGKQMYTAISQSKSKSRKDKEAYLFDIINHYNLAREIFSQEDRKQALQLNIQAAKKAYTLTSFEGMLNYALKAKSLLTINSWDDEYETTIKVFQLLIKASFLASRSEEFHLDIQEYLVNITFRIQSLFVSGQFTEAYQLTTNTRQFLSDVQIDQSSPDFNFYTSLIFLAEYNDKPTKELLENIKSNQTQMQAWTDGNPTAFLHKYQLIEAELAMIEQKAPSEVMFLYDKSMNQAEQNGFIQEAALINEFCAKYLIKVGKSKMAKGYLLDAYQLYQQSDNQIGVKQILESYPKLLIGLELNQEELHEEIQKPDESLLPYTNEALSRRLQKTQDELEKTKEELGKQQALINEQSLSLKRTNTRIDLHIQAANSVQQAMLPTQSKMEVFFEDYFIINRPKNIVSGDFLWLHKIDSKIMLVVADCTGHGVPGSFMTLLTMSILDKIIQIEKVLDPAQILLRLHEEIFIRLQQDKTNNHNGLDATVISLEQQVNHFKLTFAGAKNNLLFWNSKTQNMNSLQGDRKSIGGIQNKAIHFNNQEVILPQGSLIYLGSDGLKNQNDQQRKKFGAEHLENILLDNALLSLSDQQSKVEQALNKHMKGTTQRDDILWLGIKL